MRSPVASGALAPRRWRRRSLTCSSWPWAEFPRASTTPSRATFRCDRRSAPAFSRASAARRRVLLLASCLGRNPDGRGDWPSPSSLAWLSARGAAGVVIPWKASAARLRVLRGLIDRCRFYPMPVDDIERLALWCRDHTPTTARFIGPPGPKTFGSGRDGAWPSTARQPLSRRGTGRLVRPVPGPCGFPRPAGGIRAGLPRRPPRVRGALRCPRATTQRAALASGRARRLRRRRRPRMPASRVPGPSGPLELLHVEGQYAVYRVDRVGLVHRQR